MFQGFSHFSGFLHHFILTKLATSSIRVKSQIHHIAGQHVISIMMCDIKFRRSLLKGLSLTSIFFDSIIDILFFDSDYFDSILKNCTKRIFSHVPHYFCG